MLILAGGLFKRKYSLPGTRRSALSLAAALAVILTLVAGVDIAARNWKLETVAGDHGRPLRVLAESP